MPVGISGKTIHLLSGGIDSPVAALEMMKRGVKVDFLSFISPPHTDEMTIKKLKMIVEELTKGVLRLMQSIEIQKIDRQLLIINATLLTQERNLEKLRAKCVARED